MLKLHDDDDDDDIDDDDDLFKFTYKLCNIFEQGQGFIHLVDIWCKYSGHKVARVCAHVRVCAPVSSFVHTCCIKAQEKPHFYSYMCV